MSQKLRTLSHAAFPWRKMAGRVAFCVAFAAALTSCGTSQGGTLPPPSAEPAEAAAGPEVPVVYDRSLRAYGVGAGIDDVWLALRQAYEQVGVPVAMSDPPQHRMGNLAFRGRRIGGERLSRYLDCGQGMAGPYADEYDVSMSLVTELQERGENQTVLLTEVDAKAQARAVRGTVLSCTSKGALERRVAEAVAEQLRMPEDTVRGTG